MKSEQTQQLIEQNEMKTIHLETEALTVAFSDIGAIF